MLIRLRRTSGRRVNKFSVGQASSKVVLPNDLDKLEKDLGKETG